ncbi:MAG TPA: two-component regulator propeller domain-containing protein [Candidatus Acidoferrales bacterium]|nr:two-component regulator propeller domain-containing protein [Candidatus Acidoferrales bacterium]
MTIFLLVCGALSAKLLPVRTYTIADGLPRDTINCIQPDTLGFLWFCTPEGLSRFDGYQFTNYGVEQGLPHPNVNAFLAARDGTYWVATAVGLSLFDPAAQTPELRFRNFSPAMGTPQGVSVVLEDRQGTIWCGTGGGLYRVEDRTPSRVRFVKAEIGMAHETGYDGVVRSLMEDRHGSLWVGTLRGVYRRSPDGRTDRFTPREGLPANEVFSLLEDRQGRLWAGTLIGLCLIRPDAAPAADHGAPICQRVYTTRDGLPVNRIQDLHQTSDGRLWIAAAIGLSELIPGAVPAGGKSLRTYRAAEGLADNSIDVLGEDREGNLWVGTQGGAKKIARSGLVTYTEDDGSNKGGIPAIVEDAAGRLCVFRKHDGEHLDLQCFDGERFQTIPPNYGPGMDYVGWGWNQTAVRDHLGEWWIATGHGLFRFPAVARTEDLARLAPKAVYTTRDGLADRDIFRLYEDRRGDLWITLTNYYKLYHWERATGHFRALTKEEFPFADRGGYSYGEDASGNLWIGQFSAVTRYRGGRFQSFAEADGIPPGTIWDIHLDHAGRLWMASGEGLVRLDDVNAARPRFIVYRTPQGLSSNNVRCIAEDLQGRIYAGTGRGLDRLDPGTGRWKHYTSAEGLVSGTFQTAFRDRLGTLWFGTNFGLSQLVPEPDVPRAPPAVLVTGLRIAGKPWALPGWGQSLISGPELSRRESLGIDFAGPSFSPGETLRYQYRFEGLDPEWSSPVAQRGVEASLAPGRYRFQVRAVNQEDVVSTAPAEISFTVLSPLWQRWWFLCLAALGAGAAVLAAHHYRLRHVLAVEQLRMRIATDLHDDIGSSLSEIAIVSEVAHRRLDARLDPQVDHQGDPGAREVAGRLSDISRTSRELVDSMSDIVWSIDPKRDRFGDLAQRMHRFGADMLTPRGIVFLFHAQPAALNLELTADVKRQLFLIFKESVHNIARHAVCGHAEASLWRHGAWLLLAVHDDGTGFDPSQAVNGHGLRSMRERAAALGGDLNVDTAHGGGTALKLRVPLHPPADGLRRYLPKGTVTWRRWWSNIGKR